MMRRRFVANVILALLSMIVWLGSALARVENQRYLMAVGVCKSPSAIVCMDFPTWEARRAAEIANDLCLETQQSRTSPLWHIYYALGLP